MSELITGDCEFCGDTALVHPMNMGNVCETCLDNFNSMRWPEWPRKIAYTVHYDHGTMRGLGQGVYSQAARDRFMQRITADGATVVDITDELAAWAALQREECLDGPDGCEGEKGYHSINMGRGFIRCAKHWDERLDKQVHIDELMSPHPAPWFDESYAGERWEEEEA